MTTSEPGLQTRRLAAALEPVTGQVYFAAECHQEYEQLGFSPSPGALPSGVKLPDGAAYFTSRGSVMGQVPGELVAAAFAVFNPQAVVPAVAHGWTLCDAPTICAARTRGGTAQLVRILGEEPEGLQRATRIAGSSRRLITTGRSTSLFRTVAPRASRRSGG